MVTMTWFCGLCERQHIRSKSQRLSFSLRMIDDALEFGLINSERHAHLKTCDSRYIHKQRCYSKLLVFIRRRRVSAAPKKSRTSVLDSVIDTTASGSLTAYVRLLDQRLQVANTQNQIEPVELQNFEQLGQILTSFVCRTGIDMPATTSFERDSVDVHLLDAFFPLEARQRPVSKTLFFSCTRRHSFFGLVVLHFYDDMRFAMYFDKGCSRHGRVCTAFEAVTLVHQFFSSHRCIGIELPEGDTAAFVTMTALVSVVPRMLARHVDCCGLLPLVPNLTHDARCAECERLMSNVRQQKRKFEASPNRFEELVAAAPIATLVNASPALKKLRASNILKAKAVPSV